VAIEKGRGASGHLYFDDGATPIDDIQTHPFAVVNVTLDRLEVKLQFHLTSPCTPAVRSSLNTTVTQGEVFNLSRRPACVLAEYADGTYEKVVGLYSPSTKAIDLTELDVLRRPTDLCQADPPYVFVFVYSVKQGSSKNQHLLTFCDEV
jgi:hypothetical protein